METGCSHSKTLFQRRFPDGLKTIVGVGAAQAVTQLWSVTRDSRFAVRCQEPFQFLGIIFLNV